MIFHVIGLNKCVKFGAQFIFFFFSSISCSFSGLVVARLPFLPFGVVQGMSHRGLENEDYYECSYMLIYVVASMAIRPLVPHLLGTCDFICFFFF